MTNVTCLNVTMLKADLFKNRVEICHFFNLRRAVSRVTCSNSPAIRIESSSRTLQSFLLTTLKTTTKTTTGAFCCCHRVVSSPPSVSTPLCSTRDTLSMTTSRAPSSPTCARFTYTTHRKHQRHAERSARPLLAQWQWKRQ